MKQADIKKFSVENLFQLMLLLHSKQQPLMIIDTVHFQLDIS